MARQVVRYCSDVGAVISASFWPEITLIIPLYVGTASIVTLLLHLFWVSRPGLKLRAQYFKTVTTEPEHAPEAHSIAEHVESHGGITIFSFKAARLVGCLVLLSLSIVSLASDSEDDEQETSTFAFSETKPHKSLRAMVMTYVRVPSRIENLAFNGHMHSFMLLFLQLFPSRAARSGEPSPLSTSTRSCYLLLPFTFTGMFSRWPQMSWFPSTSRKVESYG
jgi:hypothetical protein